MHPKRYDPVKFWFWSFTGVLSFLLALAFGAALYLARNFELGAGDPLEPDPPYSSVRVFGVKSCPQTVTMLKALSDAHIPHTYHMTDNMEVYEYLESRYLEQLTGPMPWVEVHGEIMNRPAPSLVIEKFTSGRL